MTDDESLPGEATVTVESATPEDPVDQAERERVAKLLKIARKQLRTGLSALEYFRKEAADDTKFRAGTWRGKSTQWPEGVQEQRSADQRPCETVNRIPSFIRQVTNQARAAHLRILVSPVDNTSDPKKAETIQSIIRNIETQSFADRAYAMGSSKQAEQGLGIIGIVAEWAEPENEKSFKQRLKIVREPNPLQIVVDPAAREMDWSDGDWGFKLFDLDDDTYEAQIGKPPPDATSLDALALESEISGDWFPNGKTRVALWFNREARGERKRMAQLSNGDVIPYPNAEQTKELADLGITVRRDRWVQKRVMMMRKINGLEILEESEWPCKQVPFTPVIGEELEIDGEKDYRGVTRDAKGAARGYNVQVSALYEAIGLGQKAPVVGYTGTFGKPGSAQRRAWETANRKPHAFLEVDPTTIDGKPAPFIGRQSFGVDVGGIVQGIQQTDGDLKTTGGYQDASLAERGPQESGRAIVARQRQDELGNSHYLDNLRFALCSVGRQLIQLIRVYYDEPTVVRITGADGKKRNVMVFSGAKRDPRNEEFLKRDEQGNPIPFALPDGVSEIYDLSVGEFDVEVSAAPDAGSRRQESVEAMTALFQSLPPEIAAKFLDLYFLVMDFPMARAMSERAKKLMPPELQDEDEGGAPAVPPQVMAKMQQLQAELQQLQAAYQEAKAAADGEQAKIAAQVQMKQAELQSRERIAAFETQAELVMKQAEIQADQGMAAIKAEIEKLKLFITVSHEDRMADKDRAHDVGLTAMDHRHAIDVAAVKPEPSALPELAGPDGAAA